MQKWTGALVALVVASAVGCKKDLHTSPVAAVLPGDVASKLSKQELAFLEVLPGDVTGFGYVELGMSLDEIIPPANDYRGLSDDFVEMAKRRWGIEVKNVRGFGIAAQGEKYSLVLDLGSGAMVPAQGQDFATAKLGALTVLGKADAVGSLVASAQKGPSLFRAKPEWIKRALGPAAGQSFFFSVSGDTLRTATKEEDGKVLVQSLEEATFVAGKQALAAYLTAKPGQMGTVRGPVELALGKARSELDGKLAGMAGAGPDAIASILAKHYGHALLDGIAVREQGDVLEIRLPLREPQLPATSPSPALSERVVVADEWAVVQLDLGAPMLQTLIAFSDVFGNPLDRARLHGELLAEVSKVLDVPAIDPRTATVSAGGMSAVVSLHTAKGALPGNAFPVMKGEGVAAATPWGVAVTLESMSSVLTDSLRKPGAPLPLLAQSKLLGDGKAFLRGAIDFDRLPMMAKAMTGSIPVRSAEFTATALSFDSVVVAKPGQAQQIVGLVNMAKGMVEGQSAEQYQNRKTASPEAEAKAIVQYHMGKSFSRAMTPKVEGDRLTFSYKMPSAAMPQNTAAAMFAIVAIAGAAGFVHSGDDQDDHGDPDRDD